MGCNADKSQGQCKESSNSTAVCMCRPEYQGEGCEQATTEGLLDAYLNGWNPIGTAIIAVLATAVVAVLVGIVINYSKGLRGINAVPGVNAARSKVKGTEYEQAGTLEGQRNASNY